MKVSTLSAICKDPHNSQVCKALTKEEATKEDHEKEIKEVNAKNKEEMDKYTIEVDKDNQSHYKQMLWMQTRLEVGTQQVHQLQQEVLQLQKAPKIPITSNDIQEKEHDILMSMYFELIKQTLEPCTIEQTLAYYYNTTTTAY